VTGVGNNIQAAEIINIFEILLLPPNQMLQDVFICGLLFISSSMSRKGGRIIINVSTTLIAVSNYKL
jgi:hypothetical protein